MLTRILVLSIPLLVCNFAAGQCVLEQLIEDADVSSHYSEAVAASENYVVVGAYNAGDEDEGAAWVYRRESASWVLDEMLTASDAFDGDSFGFRVAADGDRVVVASPNDSPDGAAYVFRRDPGGWVEEDKLTTGIFQDGFGVELAIHGDHIAVGAPLSGAGDVFMYQRSGTEWNMVTHLEPPGGASGDRFGSSLSIDGDQVIIGAPLGDSSTSLEAGEAYIFSFNGTVWEHETTLFQLGVGNTGQLFGGSVSLHGNRAVCSETAVDDDTGQVTVYTKEAGIWNLVGEVLTASDAMEEDRFGCSVALFDDTLLVAANRADENGTDSGKVYLFEFDMGTWTEVTELIPDSVDADDQFGSPMDLDSGTAVIAADNDQSTGIATGSAYVYAIFGQDCNDNGVLDLCDINAGPSSDTNSNGVPDECEPVFIRGDTDGNGVFNGLADGLYILEHGFLGGPPPPCLEAGDADASGVLNALQDGVYVLNHQFLGGPPPVAPYPDCGLDASLPFLGCDTGCP